MVGCGAMVTPQDRLLGLLAVQLGFLTSDALRQHLARLEKSGLSFGAHLIREGALTHAEVALLEACAAQSQKTHGGADHALTRLSQGAQVYTESFGGFDATVDSKESGSTSLEGLAFVVPELPGRYLGDGLPELGRGGLGRVIALKDQVLGRTIALKELHREATRDASPRASLEREARFLREARLASQLEHPGIVPIYEAGRRVDGSLYYTMRRIEGRTLADALAAAKDLDGRLKLMPHLVAMAQALAYAHSRDVLHRDVKPHNVMLGRFGETYLLDWGLAKLKSQPQRTSEDGLQAPDITGSTSLGAVGTPSYMSPEQAAGKHDGVDERTDVWGLGAVLYEVLTGRPPYTGTSAIDCIQHILTDDVLPVRALQPEAPEDLVAVCEKALRRSPAERYASATGLAADLQAWLEGRTVTAREYSSWSLLGRVVRRNKVAFSVVSALLVVLIASAGFFTWRIDTERRAARSLSTFLLKVIAEDLNGLPGAEPLLDRVIHPSIDFFRAQTASLSDDERVLFAQNLSIAATSAQDLARRDEAQRGFDECLRVIPPEAPLAQRNPRARAVSLGCVVGQLDSARLAGDTEGMKAGRALLARIIEAHESEQLDSIDWLNAMALGASRITVVSQLLADDETYQKYLHLEHRLDTRAIALAPNDLLAIINFAASSTLLSSQTFKPDQPDESLTLVKEGLERLRTVPRRLQNPRVLRAWGAALQQLVTSLVWAGRRDEAKTYLPEAERVFEQLIALEPKDVRGRGVYADFLLALDRPCQALELLDAVHRDGVRGDYFTSRLLAALACGKHEPFADAPAELAKSDDPQAHWLYATWLAQQGRPVEAARLLREWREQISHNPVQWPLGVLDGLPARTPPAQRDAVETFIREMEAALRAEESVDMGSITDAFAARLAP